MTRVLLLGSFSLAARSRCVGERVGREDSGQRNLTYADVPAIEAFLGSPLDQKVVVYCWTNSMALAAGPQLVAHGYSQVRYHEGGLSAWKSAGQPVEYHDP
jgi:rhodanese-related sulfurtransferase